MTSEIKLAFTQGCAITASEVQLLLIIEQLFVIVKAGEKKVYVTSGSVLLMYRGLRARGQR